MRFYIIENCQNKMNGPAKKLIFLGLRSSCHFLKAGQKPTNDDSADISIFGGLDIGPPVEFSQFPSMLSSWPSHS